jgi:hypothetical protein
LSGVNFEALAFSLVWIIIAMAGWMLAGWVAGVILSVGMLFLIMISSAIIFSTSGNLLVERSVRWGILIASALALLSYIDLNRS